MYGECPYRAACTRLGLAFRLLSEVVLGVREGRDIMGSARGRGTCSSARIGEGASAKDISFEAQASPEVVFALDSIGFAKSKWKDSGAVKSNLCGEIGMKDGPVRKVSEEASEVFPPCAPVICLEWACGMLELLIEGGTNSLESVRSLFGCVVANALEKAEPGAPAVDGLAWKDTIRLSGIAEQLDACALKLACPHDGPLLLRLHGRSSIDDEVPSKTLFERAVLEEGCGERILAVKDFLGIVAPSALRCEGGEGKVSLLVDRLTALLVDEALLGPAGNTAASDANA